jgi:hypothetical protein
VGNRNAQKHGGYAQPEQVIAGIEDAIQDLERRLSQLAGYLDSQEDEGDVLAAMGLYGQMVSRYGRLLRDQKALGDKSSGILEKIASAVDELAISEGWSAFEGN